MPVNSRNNTNVQNQKVYMKYNGKKSAILLVARNLSLRICVVRDQSLCSLHELQTRIVAFQRRIWMVPVMLNRCIDSINGGYPVIHCHVLKIVWQHLIYSGHWHNHALERWDIGLRFSIPSFIQLSIQNLCWPHVCHNSNMLWVMMMIFGRL